VGTWQALQEAERRRQERRASDASRARRHRAVTVASPKGGVGKTTLVANLAAYLRALREELPLLVLGLDGQDALDRTLAIDAPDGGLTLVEALRGRPVEAAAQLGQFGVRFVPSPPSREALAHALSEPGALARWLAAGVASGLVLMDTGSDLGLPTRAALAASDLVIVPVRDLGSLGEGLKLRELVPPERIRFVLFGLDLRIKFDRPDQPDVHAALLAELGRQRAEHFATFVSRSPAVEALGTTPERRPRVVLHGAPTSLVHRQLRALASEVLEVLDALEPLPEPSEPTDEGMRGLVRWVVEGS
jgi:cellulose biosynthesis protein BcsQ